MFKLGETNGEVCKNMRVNCLTQLGTLKKWYKNGKRKLGMLACAAAVVSFSFGSTAYAGSWNVEKDKMKITYSATEHSVSTQVYYPVSGGGTVKLVTAGVNYKTYKKGISACPLNSEKTAQKQCRTL